MLFEGDYITLKPSPFIASPLTGRFVSYCFYFKKYSAIAKAEAKVRLNAQRSTQNRPLREYCKIKKQAIFMIPLLAAKIISIIFALSISVTRHNI